MPVVQIIGLDVDNEVFGLSLEDGASSEGHALYLPGGCDIEGSTGSAGRLGRMRSMSWWAGLTLGVTGFVPGG